MKTTPTIEHVDVWQCPEYIQGKPGNKIITRHYDIYTTVEDRLILQRLPLVMESAFEAYCQLANYTSSKTSLNVYFFASRQQWEDFTLKLVKPNPQEYLQIKSGAYCYQGNIVAYHIGRKTNFSIVAHEGWHQFRGLIAKGDFPAWLDECIACSFESWKEEDRQLIFDAKFNGARLMALKKTIANGKLFSLEQMLRSEPGQMVNANEADAYYAQLYSLSRFLHEYDYCYYELNFRKILIDSIECKWQKEFEYLPANTRKWNSVAGLEMFKRYVNSDMATANAQYRSFCLKLAQEARFKQTY
ncbi:MAG: hypothetical protein JEZ07_13705 [Phycisphaerae bacterium]|nr:hypothetical protein [Phycisphaerae bacterium]